MGKFTDAAKRAAEAHYSKKSEADQSTAFHSDPTGDTALEAGKHWTEVFVQKTHEVQKCTGVVVVKDRSGNAFYVASDASTGIDAHAEDNLLMKLRKYYLDLSKIPNGAKVIFYVHYSPCTKCTDKIKKDLIDKVNEQRVPATKVQFSYVFDEWYVECKANKGLANLWKDKDAAQAKYKILISDCGMTLRNNSKVRVLGIRPSTQTKGQADWQGLNGKPRSPPSSGNNNNNNSNNASTTSHTVTNDFKME